MNALALAMNFIDRLPALLQAGAAVAHVVDLLGQHKAMQDTLASEGRDPTPAEWDALNARLDALEKQLQAP